MTNPKTIANPQTAVQRTSGTAVMGHDIAGARLTPVGMLWLAVYLGLPVLALGNLIDALLQWSLGWCVGLWCIVS